MATSRKSGASSANVERPTIFSAASAFEATRLRYDEAGKTTKLGWCRLPEAKALSQHKQLLRRFHEVLKEGKVFSSKDGGFVRTENLIDPKPAETIYQEIISLFLQHAVTKKLVRVVGSQLVGCLAGDVDGVHLIFGNAKNKKLLNNMGKFRILEIGMGTGGKTRHVVERLQKQGIEFEYVFADLSMALVAAAKRQFKKVEGMSYDRLDM
ncbi:hypothetical protein F4679DRAFT_590191 [Xylaria curta]|nr:hypothetical protein F4679DRAFT_590191 [Xylaria curta]